MKNMIPFLLTCILSLVIGKAGGQDTASCKIWFDKPAESWETEALPIGNGRMGAMLYGGINIDTIQFNEQSLWSGDNNWDGEYLTGDHGFGSYRNFGEIIIEFQKQDAATNYTRSLDISNGIHRTEFVQNGVLFTREAFASHPDQVMVFKYSADAGAAISGTINLISAQGAISIATGSQMSFKSEMPNDLKYASLVCVIHDGGKIIAENDILTFERCNSIVIIAGARTNYKASFESGWRGSDPMPILEKEIREICEHWEDRLKTMPDGTLMVPDGWSPEHGPREDGVMFDQQLVCDQRIGSAPFVHRVTEFPRL